MSLKATNTVQKTQIHAYMHVFSIIIEYFLIVNGFNKYWVENIESTPLSL